MDSWFLHGKYLHDTGQVDLKNADIRALVVMSNTTAFADILAAQFLSGASGIVTLDEYTGGLGYARVALSGKDVLKDTVSKETRWIMSAFTFGATITNAARQAKAIILYKHVGADSANIPLFWIDSVNSGLVFPFSPNGGPITASFSGGIFLAQPIAA